MKKRTNEGITLIALVITIIVLLILAGISITTLTGEDGILEKANVAKTKTEKAEIIERAKTDVLAVQVDHEGKITREQFDNILENYDKDKKSDKINADGEKVIETDKNQVIKASEIYNGVFAEGEKVFYVEKFKFDYEEDMTWEDAMNNGDISLETFDRDKFTLPGDDWVIMVDTTSEGYIYFYSRSYENYYIKLDNVEVKKNDKIIKGAHYTIAQ